MACINRSSPIRSKSDEVILILLCHQAGESTCSSGYRPACMRLLALTNKTSFRVRESANDHDPTSSCRNSLRGTGYVVGHLGIQHNEPQSLHLSRCSSCAYPLHTIALYLRPLIATERRRPVQDGMFLSFPFAISRSKRERDDGFDFDFIRSFLY
jgi:hypothetical protein